MTIAATFSVSDADILASLKRALQRLNVVLVRDEVLMPVSPWDLTVYKAQEANWLPAAPSAVYVNGAVVALSEFAVNFATGTVTFTPARVQTDVVTASFVFTPYTDADLVALIGDALTWTESQVAQGLDEAAVPRAYKTVLVTQAAVFAVRGLMMNTAEYYRYTIDGREVDKNGVTAHYDRILTNLGKALDGDLAFLRVRAMAEGRSVPLNIDRGRAPSRYSMYRGRG